MATFTFATAFPTTAPTTPNASSSSLKRRMSPHAPVWPEYDAPVPTMSQSSHLHLHHQQQQQTLHQPCFKRARLSHSSPGELCLQRDLKSLTHSHRWNYQSHLACWVYEQDPNIRLHKSNGNFGEQHLLVLEFSQDANITIEIPRMYPHQTPTITKVQGLWMDAIVIRQPQCQQTLVGGQQVVSPKTVVLDTWSPILHLSTLLEFCIHHAKMHPTLAHAKLPDCLGERTNTYYTRQQQQTSETMDVSHPFKYTSPFAPNRMDIGYQKRHGGGGGGGGDSSYQHQAPSQDAMEM